MNDLTQHLEAYKQALKDQDTGVLLREKAKLTEAVTWALLEQDKEQIKTVRACLANLAPLADHFDETGNRGDRWRALGEVLRLVSENNKPLEQLRLALPNTVSGKILREIQAQAGITPSELSARLNKGKTHIANELKKLEAHEDALETEGLIIRLKRGKQHELFLSALGKKILDSITPVEQVSEDIMPSQRIVMVNADIGRLEKIEQAMGNHNNFWNNSIKRTASSSAYSRQ